MAQVRTQQRLGWGRPNLRDGHDDCPGKETGWAWRQGAATSRTPSCWASPQGEWQSYIQPISRQEATLTRREAMLQVWAQHDPAQCHFREVQCHACGKRGHIKKVAAATQWLPKLVSTCPSTELSKTSQVTHRSTHCTQSLRLRLKKEKCAFLLPEVEYLGHKICRDGLQPTETKVRVVAEAPEPQRVDELRSFLGLVNYYGKFLYNLASTAAHLYQLLQKNAPWVWGKVQRAAFKEVKKLLQSSDLLVHFSWSWIVMGRGSPVPCHGGWNRETNCLRIPYPSSIRKEVLPAG